MSGYLLYGTVLICPSIESLYSAMFELTLGNYKIFYPFNDISRVSPFV
jgi:hypothetical protein